jgi:hypothetical protein
LHTAIDLIDFLWLSNIIIHAIHGYGQPDIYQTYFVHLHIFMKFSYFNYDIWGMHPELKQLLVLGDVPDSEQRTLQWAAARLIQCVVFACRAGSMAQRHARMEWGDCASLGNGCYSVHGFCTKSRLLQNPAAQPDTRS